MPAKSSCRLAVSDFDMDLMLLSSGADALGFPLSDRELRQFSRYFSELLKWNAKVNLTAITDSREIVIKHFLDSLALRRILPPRKQKIDGPQMNACDIGSGAGFPGLALKIVMPEMAITLVEPILKKSVFLRQMIRTLNLSDAMAFEVRAEELKEKIAASFDLVFSRAFKAPDELLPLAAPILKEGGHVALSLGPGMEYEPQPGWETEREEEITLPFSDIQRRLILLKKL